MRISIGRQPLIIAHRGASGSAPESTACAIRRAVAVHADMIELDVQLTRDNRLVIFHDDRLDRTTDGAGLLRRWPYRELARLGGGGWFDPRFSGERILLASAALRMIPRRCAVNVELKRTRQPSMLIERLASCLQWTRTARRVLASSFEPHLLERLAAARPRVARGLLCRRNPGRWLRRALQLGCVSFHPHASLITPWLVAQAHEAGLRVFAWTIDSPAQARRLIRLGVDGIFTNRPERLRGLRNAVRRQTPS
jgi:glycerophosphoryl diester phosphodiesterase